ncbi:MAG: DUF1501 domain-containing protein [Planctomycetaceae bacterium]|jgi:hypothetical protein|nr:DUF1501 domain-containing protein [Planctomycetaceae bacterium]MCE2813819.1 DUF1501 domain-containing protein [Planctomycetaceae bacterium]
MTFEFKHPSACESYRNLLLAGSKPNRRDLLRCAPIAAAGATSFWTSLAESIAKSPASAKTPKALILVWLQGGPSQLETFDPHPSTSIGGSTQAIKTSLRDIQIANTLEQTAEVMHHATLIRSMVSKEGDHERATYNMKTGWRPDPTLLHPSIGSVLCHNSTQSLEIPRHVSILSGQWPARGGYLGSQFDAFQLGDPKNPLPNLRSPVESKQFQQRITDLELLEQRFRKGRIKNLESDKTLHSISTERAVKMMSSEQIQAFEIDREANSVREPFGDSPFGRGCLAAVRLIEQGVTCVEIELSGWDSHIENHTLQSGRCSILDPALASLIRLLDERGLLDSTVVVCGGEFGRTPKINIADGRDHWPNGFSAAIFGGPFRRGYVHGETSHELLENNSDPLAGVKDPVRIEDLHATILHSFGIDSAVESVTPIGRPLAVSQGSIIKELLET